MIKAPTSYPPCGVAMWLRELYQPTEPGVTYIAGHARKGMFLPLLNASKTNDGAAMIGKTIYVYTNNSARHTYTIIQVRRHVELDPERVRGDLGAPLGADVRGPQLHVSEADHRREADVDHEHDVRRRRTRRAHPYSC